MPSIRAPLYVTMFLAATASGLVASVASVVARNDLGCSGTQVGIIWTGFYAAQLVGSIGSGYLSDRVRRKYVLMGSLLWAALGYTVTGFADSFEWFLACAILTGFHGGFSSVAIAILSVTLPSEKLAKTIGRLGTVMSLGFAVGPLISTAISAIWGVEKISPKFVRQLYFFIAAFLYVVASVCASRISGKLNEAVRNSCAGGGRLTPGLILVWTSRLFSTCGVTAIHVTQVLLWQDFFGLNRVCITLMASASGLVVATVEGLLFPALVSRVGFHAALTFGISSIVLTNCLLPPVAWTGNFAPLFCCLLVFWTGFGCMGPGTSLAVTRHLKSAMNESSPAGTVRPGLALGINSSMKFTAALAVPALAGFLYDQHGPLMYLFAAGLSSMGVVAVSAAWVCYNRNSSVEVSSKSINVEVSSKSSNV